MKHANWYIHLNFNGFLEWYLPQAHRPQLVNGHAMNMTPNDPRYHAISC